MQFEIGKEYGYTTQCTDQTTGKVGDFIFDPEKGNTEGNFVAISPVFGDLAALFRYMKAEGFAPVGSLSSKVVFEGRASLQAETGHVPRQNEDEYEGLSPR